MFFKNDKIKNIKAREILDSRGNPTVEVFLEANDFSINASVPSGKSKGKYEAKELRDNDGKGVSKAIKNINEIIFPKLKGISVSNQKKIDEILIELDGTTDKSNLGANAILAVSMAVCRAGAKSKKLGLFSYINKIFPNSQKPNNNLGMCFNVINGGQHSKSNLNIQEFFIIPQKKYFSENLKIATEVYQGLEEKLKQKFGNVGLGDEGGFVPLINKTKEVLDLIWETVSEKNYSNDFKLGLDCAAGNFFNDGIYDFEEEKISSQRLADFYKEIIEKYPIILIEDPFFEDDFKAFQEFNSAVGNKIGIFGDDLTATNLERVKLAKEKELCNGMIIKPNQIGTISETIKVAELAKSFGWKILTANRSGETNDDFIADLAVGINSDFVKFGAPGPKERMAKYNRLLEIEKEL
jgi:enolase